MGTGERTKGRLLERARVGWRIKRQKRVIEESKREAGDVWD